jgi:HPt (histidine-containing phosphotransfer) domain-containing protein
VGHATAPTEPCTDRSAPQDVLDVAAGLARYEGNAELYRRLLATFVDGHSDDPERLEHALQGQDEDGIQRIVHGLKGIAGMLGAPRLQALAIAAMQDGCERSGGMPPPEPIQALILELRLLLAAIRRHIEGDGNTGDQAMDAGSSIAACPRPVLACRTSADSQ